MLAWLSVWSQVQTCIWPSWCHCRSLSLASVKYRLVLPFWYRLTRVVLDKGMLNDCVCTGRQRQHHCCLIVNKVENIDHRQVKACQSTLWSFDTKLLASISYRVFTILIFYSTHTWLSFSVFDDGTSRHLVSSEAETLTAAASAESLANTHACFGCWKPHKLRHIHTNTHHHY